MDRNDRIFVVQVASFPLWIIGLLYADRLEYLWEFTAWTVSNPVSSLILLFIEFAVLFELYHRSKGTGLEYIVMLVFAAPFLLQDVLLNYVLSIIFLDTPAGAFETISMRLQRYLNEYRNKTDRSRMETVRYRTAKSICKHLHKHDPYHCV